MYITIKKREKGVLQTYFWGFGEKGVSKKYTDAKTYTDKYFILEDLPVIYEELDPEEVTIHAR